VNAPLASGSNATGVLVAPITGSGVRRRWWTANVGLIAGSCLIVLMLLAGFFMPLPYNPVTPDIDAQALPPSGTHLFGTDLNGFDVFSRTVSAASNDLPLALIGTAFSLLAGVVLGLLVSTRGAASERIMRGLDALQAFPLLILSIAIVTLAGNRVEDIILAIALISVPRFMRLIRSEAVVLRETRFIEAAVAIGCSPARLLSRHILPNVSGVILVECSVCAANAIVVIASLNFLGVGFQPPEPTWGSMIQIGARSISQGQWWMALFPGLAVFITLAALNLIADGADKLLAGER
jgi:peptide/nickel transport system permease protein